MERKFVGIVGLLVAIALLVAGFCIAVPDNYIPSWKDLDQGGMEEYVGGDAYNFIIEAGLRGGEIAGATISKAVCFAASGIALILALYAFCGKAAEAQPPARRAGGVRPCVGRTRAAAQFRQIRRAAGRPAALKLPGETGGGAPAAFLRLTAPAVDAPLGRGRRSGGSFWKNCWGCRSRRRRLPARSWRRGGRAKVPRRAARGI